MSFMRCSLDEEIGLINEIISAAIYHGGDCGGPYFSDFGSLDTAVNNWLEKHEINDTYFFSPYEEIPSIKKIEDASKKELNYLCKKK